MLWLLLAGIGAIVLAHTAPFPFLLERFAPSRSMWRMPASGAQIVYLTYDDGPNPAATPEVLDVLARDGARATFFLIDAHLTETTAPIVRRMFAEGHAVALHSDTRALMINTPDDLAARLTRQADRIEQLGGRRPCPLFRPHAGWRSGSMYEGLARIDHRLVGWSWGLWDWNWYRPREAERLARRLAARVSPGDIVVLHDGHHVDPEADRRYAIEATARLLPALKARGYRFGLLCGGEGAEDTEGADFTRRHEGAETHEGDVRSVATPPPNRLLRVPPFALRLRVRSASFVPSARSQPEEGTAVLRARPRNAGDDGEGRQREEGQPPAAPRRTALRQDVYMGSSALGP